MVACSIIEPKVRKDESANIACKGCGVVSQSVISLKYHASVAANTAQYYY